MREGAVPPDRVLYGVFLRHEAAFEKLAWANESKGLSGDAYRNHFIQKFGLTPDEQRQIGEIALNYDEQWSGLREQTKSAARDFRALKFPNDRRLHGAPPPPKSPELVALSKQMHAVTLSGRDRIHSVLGDARFAQLDSLLRSRARHDFSGSSAAPINGGKQ